jgi:hypothetical protein
VWQNNTLEIRDENVLVAKRRSESGGVAQLGERYVRNVQVRGSNPLISTIFLKDRKDRGYHGATGKDRQKDQRDGNSP